MEKIIIKGGKELRGSVRVSGSKNAALPVIAAALLADGACRLKNVPKVKDIQTMCQMVEVLGGGTRREPDILVIDPCGFSCRPAPYDLVCTMRASVYVLAPLLSRFRKARVALPGGCAIGLRPLDQHLKGLEALGARVKMEHGYIEAEAAQVLHGAEIYLDVASVGATVNILLAAVLAKGRTVLDHAACEPEIVNLAGFLSAMGAKIQGAGTNRILIEGVKSLAPVVFQIIPDRIEAGTLAIAAAITRGDVLIEEFPRQHLSALEQKLSAAGIELQSESGSAVRVKCKSEELLPIDIVTLPYPGFPTDVQAQWMALMCRAAGRSVITESIWENRFMHVAELKRMGANIRIEGNNALVRGGGTLSGAQVMASDLRASAALILAGLVAEGQTSISRIYHLDRGYEKLEDKLAALGAEIRREPE